MEKEYEIEEIMSVALNKFSLFKDKELKNRDYVEINNFLEEFKVNNSTFFSNLLVNLNTQNKNKIEENKSKFDRQLKYIRSVIDKFENINFTKKKDILENIFNTPLDSRVYKEMLLECGDEEKYLEELELIYQELRLTKIKNDLISEYLDSIVKDEELAEEKKIEAIRDFGKKIGLEDSDNELLKKITSKENYENEKNLLTEQNYEDQKVNNIDYKKETVIPYKELGIAIIFVIWCFGMYYIISSEDNFIKNGFLLVKSKVLYLKDKILKNDGENAKNLENSEIALGWDKSRLFEGLKEFQQPITEFETDSLKFRIDLMETGNYRLAVWHTGDSLESQPVEIIDYSSLINNVDGTINIAFLGSWHCNVKFDKSYKPIAVELDGAEAQQGNYEVIKVTYFSNPLERIENNNENTTPNKNISDEKINGILETNGIISNNMEVMKQVGNKVLVSINEGYEASLLAIVDASNETLTYTQYGNMFNEINENIVDKNGSSYWVIKTQLFNKETYIDNIGLINMDTLEGETVFSSEYPATMEADWLSYSKETYDYLNLDINKAIEIYSMEKKDINGDNYEDFVIYGRDFNGGGFLNFYAKTNGFSPQQ